MNQKYIRKEDAKFAKYLVFEEVRVFLWINFSFARQNVLARKRITLSLSHPLPTPHMKNRNCHFAPLVNFLSAKKLGKSKNYFLKCWHIPILLINIPQQSIIPKEALTFWRRIFFLEEIIELLSYVFWMSFNIHIKVVIFCTNMHGFS